MSVFKKEIINIREGMIADFENDEGITFDEENSEHDKLISDYVNNHKKKYYQQYQDVLNDFDMGIKFI